jgi:hypothetical protein
MYKTSVSGPILQCISKAEGQELPSKIYAGVCGGHIGAGALAAKVIRQGFYWPAVMDEAARPVATCKVVKNSLTGRRPQLSFHS